MTAPTFSGHTEAKITPEKIAALQERVGSVRPANADGLPPFNIEAHADSIRHFVNGSGDDNPLFTNPAYAEKTRWGGVIAPPMYASQTMGLPDVVLKEGQKLPRLRDPLRGIHVFVSGTEHEFYQPLRPGDTLYRRSALFSVTEKRSAFGGGVSVHVRNRSIARNQRREPVQASYTLLIHTEREAAASAGKYREHKRPFYTPEMIAEIDAAYGNEYVRGAEPRYWEDVNVGDELPRMVRGPLMVVDIIGQHIAMGHGGYDIGPLKLGYKNRKRIPGFYIPNEWGFPDVSQRCHWDDAWAQAVGNPYAYDYFAMRDNWLAQYVVNWMGDDAWLWKFHSEMRRFNYVGDVQWFHGKVVNKYLTDEGTPAVDLEFWGQNQDGEVTCPSNGTVLLPSREKGLPRLPTPPEDIRLIAARGREVVDAADYENDR